MTDGEAPKIIVDSDWKSQAEAERAKLAEQEKAAQEAKAAAAGPQGPLTFSEVVKINASQAATYLGLVPDPQSGQRMLAPDLAKLYIDMLAILEDKTKGNLTDEESKELTSTVNELRMVFVETMKAVDQAVAEGKLDPKGGAFTPSGGGTPAVGGAGGGAPGGGAGGIVFPGG